MRVPTNNPAYSFGCTQARKVAAEKTKTQPRDEDAKAKNNWRQYFVAGGLGIPATALAAKALMHAYVSANKTPVIPRHEPDPPPIKLPPLDSPATLPANDTKSAEDLSLGRVLGTSLAATGGGLLLGSYPGMKLQQMSEAAGNPELVNFAAGKMPIIFAGSLSAGLYNFLQDQANKKKREEHEGPQEPESMAKYLKYLVY